MSLFRVRLHLKAPLGTPLSSGTLFGHLCWARREVSGEVALTTWLAGLPDSPWALSDGFPAGRLPRPLLPPVPRRRERSMTPKLLEELEEIKAKAKWPWINADGWGELRTAVSPAAVEAHTVDAAGGGHRIAHNSIDRRTGSTPEEGGLYFLDEDWSFAAAPGRDVYVRAETTAAELTTLFGAVGEAGYGRDATWGRGHFTVAEVTDAGWLDDHAGDRMVSLSHGCLSANMAEPRYKLFTHFGKVAAGVPTTVPWKYPLLLARPGATFAPADTGPFGAWLTGVHQDRPEVGHNAWHLAIPYTEAAAEAAP